VLALRRYSQEIRQPEQAQDLGLVLGISEIESATRAQLRAARAQERQVGVGGHPHASVRRIAHHVEEARVHQRLAQTLQVQPLEVRHLVDQPAEDAEVHERERTIGRAVLAELYGAHLAAQIAQYLQGTS
jgi:hypothetical protein